MLLVAVPGVGAARLHGSSQQGAWAEPGGRLAPSSGENHPTIPVFLTVSASCQGSLMGRCQGNGSSGHRHPSVARSPPTVAWHYPALGRHFFPCSHIDSPFPHSIPHHTHSLCNIIISYAIIFYYVEPRTLLVIVYYMTVLK